MAVKKERLDVNNMVDDMVLKMAGAKLSPVMEAVESPAVNLRIEKGKYKQKTFYISDEHIQQIRTKAFYRNTDQSVIVREALELYFNQEENQENQTEK